MNFFIILISLIIAIYIYAKFILKTKHGIDIFNNGDIQKSIDYYSQFIDRIHSKSKKSIIYGYRGYSYLKIGKYNEAVSDLVNSLNFSIIPNLNMILISIFFCNIKEYDRAIKYLSKAAEIKHDSSIIYLNLGLVYYYKNEYDTAIRFFEKASKYKCNENERASIYTALGATYIKLKNYDKANNNICKSLKIYPDNYSSHTYHALLLILQGENALAEKTALKAINLNSYNYLAYKILAEINILNENYEDFYKNIKIFLDINPNGYADIDLNDNIYTKIKNDKNFKQLISEAKDNALSINKLKTSIDDSKFLNDNTYNKQKITNKIKLIIALFILFMVIYIQYKYNII
jgi:tetratricopeptide (TPR) repeat protein